MHWLHTQMALLDAASSVAAFAVNWLLQSGLLIAAGLAVAWLARRHGAAVQSAIYRTTLAAVVVCPLATLLLSLNGVSGWSLPVPAAWSYKELPVLASAEPDGVIENSQVGLGEGEAPAKSSVEQASRLLAHRPTTEQARRSFYDVQQDSAPQSFPQVAAPLVQGTAPGAGPEAAVAASSERAPAPQFQVYAFGFVAIAVSSAWLLGTTLLVARLTLAWRRLNRLMVAAIPAEAAVQEACWQAARLVGVAAPKVLLSPYATSPCLIAAIFCRERTLCRSAKDDATSTCGARNGTESVPYGASVVHIGQPRAAILLPELTPALPLRDVLIHELAHLRRGDARWNLVVRLTEALFFYQPLVWLLARRLEASAEEVCDDYVVQLGGDRSQYARGLLEIAEQSTTPLGATAVAMVSLRSILARRVTRIMDPARSLSTRAGNLLVAVVIAGGLLGATFAGFVGLGQHPSASADPMSDTAAKEPTEAADNTQPAASESVANPKTKATGSDDAQKPAARASTDSEDDVVTVTGKVVDPQGKPFVGAKLYAVRWYWEPHIPHPPLAESKSDRNGRFTVSFRKSQFTIDLGQVEQWKNTTLVAASDGFAPGWVTLRDIAPGAEPTLRLVKDMPITGRVVDLEGRSIAGVTVKVAYVYNAKDGSLDDWLGAVRRGELPNVAARYLEDSLPQVDDLSPETATDDNGDFKLPGIGSERLAELAFSGPTIAYSQARVATREIEPLTLRMGNEPYDKIVTVYGADVQFVASPAQAITGMVRDAKTHEPLSGVEVLSWRYSAGNYVDRRALRAVSDETGRYRLTGMPKGKGNAILAVPNDEQPYFMRAIDVPDPRGLEAIALDIELHRGIAVTGRVTDKATGEPLPARLYYLPFLSNEFAQEFPEFHPSGSVDGFQQRYSSRPDGSYRLVALPGRAIVGALCVVHPYRVGVGSESIDGMNDRGNFATYRNPVEPGKQWPNAIKEINPARGAEKVVCDLALDRGESVVVKVLDPDEAPLTGFETYGRTAGFEAIAPAGTPETEIINLAPDELRTVIIHHHERGLGKVVRLRLADYPSHKTSLKLEPYAKFVGRLLDRNGDPIVGASLTAWLQPNEDFSQRLPIIATDEAGRFEYDQVPTGCAYDLQADAAGLGNKMLADDLTIQPGETKDLGDVVYGGAVEGAVEKPAAARSEPANEKTVRGRVLDTSGQPVVGARVRVCRNYWLSEGGAAGAAPDPRWLADTPTDATGRFSAEFEPLSAAAASRAKSRGFSESIGVLATADGFGFVLEQVEPAASKQVEIRLPRDSSPIEGRLLDLEGRPVRGARMSVRAVAVLGDEPESLDDWLDEVRESAAGKNDASEIPNGARIVEFDSFLNPFPTATTGDDGRFTIVGLGADRVAYLKVEGDRLASAWLPVVTRPIEPLPLASGLLRFSTRTCYGARCEIVAAPEQPIRGVVRDMETGEPLKNVEVRFNFNDNVFRESSLSTTTGADGRYEFLGMPKPSERDETIELRFVPAAGQPYFRTEVTVPRQPGLDTVTCDVPLRRAVLLRGAVTDRKSGEGVRAAVRYYPLLTNAEARRYANFEPGVRKLGDDDRYATDADGRFAVPAIAGRGVLTVVAEQGDRFTLADGADALADLRLADRDSLNVYHLAGLNQDNAYRDVNIPGSAKEFTLNVELTPLPVTRLSLVDEQGNDLRGVETQGLAPMNPFADRWSNTWREPLSSAHADLLGPEADEVREVLFLDRARNLGTMVRFTADSLHGMPTRRVVLRPCGSVRGRIVDQRGEPVAGAYVDAEVVSKADTLTQDAKPAAASAQGSAWRLTLNLVQAGADGRFELRGVPPGARYAVEAFAEKRGERWRALTAEIKPGATVEVGDVAPQADGKEASAAAAEVAQPPSAVAAVNVRPTDKATGDKMQEQRKLTIRGRVTRDGKPAGGAHLAVIGHRTAVARGSDLDWGHQVLSEAIADENGEYALRLKDVSQKTHNYPRVIARQDGAAIAWRDVNLDAAETQADFELKPEVPLHVKLVDLEGQAAARVRMSIASVVERSENEDAGHGVGYRPSDHVPAAWIAPITSDDRGTLVVRGLAANQGVTLQVIGDDRFALQDIALNTGMSAERGETDGTYRPLVKNAKPGEELALALAPAQVFEGTVRYADSGAPVPNARVSIWASEQQEFGSMISQAGSADEQGHYRITPWAGIRFGLTAYPPAGTPYLARQTPLDKAIRWEGGERLKKVDLTLPRGVLVRGTIVELGTGAPVAGAAVQYHPESSNNPNESDDILTGWQAIEVTDRDGRFTIAVLPGPGRLLVNGPRGKYVLREIGSRELNSGKPGGMRYYAHAFAKLNPEAGQHAVEVKLELQPGSKAKGQIVDEAGKAIDEALVISRLNISPDTPFWRGHTTPTLGGRFELTGLAEGVEYPVYFLDAKRRLGATEIIKAGDKERTVVLKPCGKATMRLVDAKGEPMPANYGGTEMVVTPGASKFDRAAIERGERTADADFVANIDRANNPLTADEGENGVRRLNALIPGAIYRVIGKREGQITVVKEFQVKANESVDLGEITVERD